MLSRRLFPPQHKRHPACAARTCRKRWNGSPCSGAVPPGFLCCTSPDAEDENCDANLAKNGACIVFLVVARNAEPLREIRPIIGADLNSDILFIENCCSPPLGKPTGAGMQMKDWLIQHEFVAATALGNQGRHNILWKQGDAPRIDFIFVPQDDRKNLQVRTWPSLREIGSQRFPPHVFDHAALVIAFPLYVVRQRTINEKATAQRSMVRQW